MSKFCLCDQSVDNLAALNEKFYFLSILSIFSGRFTNS